MALNPSNMTVSSTGTTSETIFHIFLCTNVPILSKEKLKTSDWQLLKVLLGSRGIDLYEMHLYERH